ncbi:Rrf2 family transcriptional regulator [Jatrophihabitans lederbergiae]|uniref:Rrf2 family transcriptional regulator n=1 Tax=Jatrophihabitans lederbergiae TaxID=3075547 RepID=A0ABU2JIJ1_9ACTN|nr:Rrf2 family transcriptional regulator [Jatrophihabitans sp. DSM 44399]MDT0264068.1 Rrf2 family transcriptional regulator [Jatrophihabitans sp. DSM 44399]
MPPATNTRFAVAVHVLTYLAGVEPGQAVSSEELAGSVNVNPVHIRRVLGPLREAGLVQSRSGQHGGWTLGRPAEAIGLDELWSLVGGADRVVGMHGPNPSCPVGLGIASAMAEIECQLSAVVRAELARRTVRDLLDHVHGPPAR